MSIGVRFEHDMPGLAADLRRIGKTTPPRLRKVVQTNVREAESQIKTFTRAESGPHGSNLHKRVSSAMTGTLTGEAGFEGQVQGNAVGGGFRHGAGNTDVPRTADIIRAQFGDDVGDVADGLFW